MHNVVLVPDLAHKLLKNVLDRDDTEGAAVAVGDYRHIEAAFAHNGEQVVYHHGFVDEVRLVKKRAYIVADAAVQVGFYEGSYLKYSNNVVDVALVNGKAGVLHASYVIENVGAAH